MKDFLFFSTTLFFLFFKNSFAQQIIRVPEEKMTDKKLQIHSRIFMDNFIEDEYQSTDRSDEFKTTGARFDLVSQVFYDKKWFLYFNYRIQQDPTQSSETTRRNNSALPTGGDMSYENHFGLTRELYLGYEGEDFRVYGGKFRPTFGRAWLLGRGMRTQDLSIDYMQLERLGLGGVLKAGNKNTNGAYELGFAAYTKDTKNLDNTQITTRDPSILSNGNSGEDRSLDSYTINLDIDFDFSKGEKLFYRFAMTNLAVNSNQAVNRLEANKIEDEKSISATMNYIYPISENFNIDSLIEYVERDNINGDNDNWGRYFNSSAILNIYRNWNLTLGYSQRKLRNEGVSAVDTYNNEMSFGYSFFNSSIFDKLQIQAGHFSSRIDSKLVNQTSSLETRNNYGLLVRYIKWF